MKFPEFYTKFKKNRANKYEKIKNEFLKLISESEFNYNLLDLTVKEILHENTMLERQIIIKCLIFELDTSLINSFEIFSVQDITDISLKKTNDSDDNSNRWLDILFNSDYSNENFRIYDPFEN